VAGLQIAPDLAQSGPEARVLLLVVELTSLTLLGGDASRTNFIACALFGDGAAAAVIGAPTPEHPGLVTLGKGLTHLFPNSKDLMGWHVEEGGWRVLVSPRIPTVVKREVAGLVRQVCGDERPGCWVLHPGGQKVLDSYRTALELTDAEMEDSARVLASHGNMSAVTALFILHRTLCGDVRHGAGVATAFGPGFSAEVLGLEFTGATIR
jgi:alkylresorcinol/alkylpyrone synthase